MFPGVTDILRDRPCLDELLLSSGFALLAGQMTGLSLKVMTSSKKCLKTLLGAAFLDLIQYHSFQNHYTHEISIVELFRGLQLQPSKV